MLKFKVGDPVRLTSPSKQSGIVLDSEERECSKTNRYKVKFEEGDPKGEWWIEYFLEYDFKVGDKVIRTRNPYLGKTGIIQELNEGNMAANVVFPASGETWLCPLNTLELLKFKVGDRVIAKKPVGCKDVKDVSGDIIQIDTDACLILVEFDLDIEGHDGIGRGKDRHCWWCHESDLMFAEEPFKVGDRVIVRKILSGSDKRIQGKTGTIVNVTPAYITVEFDENIHGHSEGGKGKAGHCWNIVRSIIPDYGLELVDELEVYRERIDKALCDLTAKWDEYKQAKERYLQSQQILRDLWESRESRNKGEW